MIKEPPNGVRRYAHAMVNLYFPNGKVCCDYCPLLETYSRKQCRQTGEYIVDSKITGLWCPLKVDEEIKKWRQKVSEHHGRKIEIDDKITVHLKNPKNKVLCEVMAVQDGYKNLSQWLANIIENEIIPERFYFGGKENEKN